MKVDTLRYLKLDYLSLKFTRYLTLALALSLFSSLFFLSLYHFLSFVYLREARRAAYANGEELPPAPADAPKVMKPPPALPAAVVAFGGNPKGWSAVKNVVSESIAAHHQKATEEVSVQNKKLQGFLEAAGLKHHYDK